MRKLGDDVNLRLEHAYDYYGVGGYLGDVEVEAEALALPLHLPHAQLAGELAGAQAEPFQGERAVQVPLGAVPDVVERDFLQGGNQGKTHSGLVRSSRQDRPPPLHRHHH